MCAHLKKGVRGLFVCFIILASFRAVLAVPFAYVTNGDSNSVSVMDIATNGVVATIPVGSNPRGVAVSPTGARVYVTNQVSNDVSVIDTATNTVIATIPVLASSSDGQNRPEGIGTPRLLSPPLPAPMGIAINPAGTRVYVANTTSGDVTILDAVNNTALGSVISGSIPFGIAVHPSGNLVYVTNSGEDTVSVMDTATHTVLKKIPVGNEPCGIAVTPDGKWVYVADHGSNSWVSVISTEDHTVKTTLEIVPSPDLSKPYGVAVHPTGKWVYVTNETGGFVSVIDAGTRTLAGKITVGPQPIGVSLNHDGTRLYVAVKGTNSVSVIDTTTQAILADVPVGAAPYAFGQFVAQCILWRASVSFPIRFTYPQEDAPGHIKLHNITQTFIGRILLFESDLIPRQITFVSDDGKIAGYFRTLTSVMTDTSSRSEQLLIIGTGDFSYSLFGEEGAGIAYVDGKGTLKKGSSGAITSIILSGKIGGGVDQTANFSGSFRTTLSK